MDALLALSRGLSPACCKVLIALMMAGSALDVAALELWTGLGRKVLGRALNVLKGLGLVIPQTGPHNRQTWLPVGDSFFSGLQVGQNDATEPFTTTTTIEARARSKVVVEEQLGQNDTTGNFGEQHQRTPEFSANRAACAQFGITEPVASELAACEWVSPEYIEAHMQGLDDWDTRGLAVVRMRAGEEPPPEWSRRSPGVRAERRSAPGGRVVAPAFPPGSAGPAPENAPARTVAGEAGDLEARDLLLQASGLAALPPSEHARVGQVRAMVAAYGEEKTLAELVRQRGEWCKTRGHNGRYYSPLHMGWIDRADEALSGHGPPPQPERPILPPPPPRDDPVPRPPHVPLPWFLQPGGVMPPERNAAGTKPAAQPGGVAPTLGTSSSAGTSVPPERNAALAHPPPFVPRRLRQPARDLLGKSCDTCTCTKPQAVSPRWAPGPNGVQCRWTAGQAGTKPAVKRKRHAKR